MTINPDDIKIFNNLMKIILTKLLKYAVKKNKKGLVK